MNNFSNRKIAVLGFGVEGESIINFLLNHALPADRQGAKIVVFDEKDKNEFDKEKIEELTNKDVQFKFGKFPESLDNFDLIVKSPGIRFDKIKNFVKESIKITSPTKIFFDLAPAKIIAVTGTKGKGTTATLIYEMLKSQGLDAYLGGNIGTPPLNFLEKLTPKSWVVLELSSFQLQDIGKSPDFASSSTKVIADKKATTGKPHIAVLLMVTSEHLDYHKDTYEYVDAKRNILRFQKPSDLAVINKDYPASRESDIYTNGQIFQISRENECEQGCFIDNGKIIVRQKIDQTQNSDEEIININKILLPGKHNLENVCAAAMVATIVGVSKQNIVKVLKSFKGLEHRLELVETINGVRYYDDSFSTTPETAQAAIEAFTEPEILILGGSSKGSDFTKLGELIERSENIKAIIGIGVEWPRIKESIKYKVSSIKYVEGCKDMHDIVEKAAKIAELGDVVLLSPACASFDMFKNYKERGDQFKKEVEALKSSNESLKELKSQKSKLKTTTKN